MLQITNFFSNWVPLDPIAAGLTWGDFAELQGALRYRSRTGAQQLRKQNSVDEIGLIPKVIPVAHTDVVNPTIPPKYYILDGYDLIQDCLLRGNDPLASAFIFMVMPDEEVTLDRIAQVVVKLNRVQKKMTDKELIRFLAPSYPEYQVLEDLLGQFPYVSVGEMLNILRPYATNSQNKADFENITYAATHAARGVETIEYLNNWYEFLDTENRINLTKKNNYFVFQLAQRMISLPHIHFSYAAAPGRGKITGTIPGNTIGQVTATSRGTIMFRDVARHVGRDDVDFPKRGFKKNNIPDRERWVNQILDAMGIV